MLCFIIIVVNLLLCLIYTLYFTTGTFVEEERYLSRFVLSVVSGIHWGVLEPIPRWWEILYMLNNLWNESLFTSVW